MNGNFNFLTNLYQENKLAHFYHVKTLQKSSENTMADLLITWLKSLNIANPIDHSDILWIGYQEEANSYLVDQFKEVFKFQNYRPLSLRTKFIIINNAAKLNENVSNKLLKTLEEPSHQTTIILLNPESVALLPTVQSRAINFTLNLPTDEENIHLAEEVQKKIQSGISLNQFINDYKKTAHIDQKILKGLLSSQKNLDHQKLIDLTKSIEDGSTYHSAMANRLTHIYHFLNQ